MRLLRNDLALPDHRSIGNQMSTVTIPDPDSPEFKAAIRPVCDEQSWIYAMSRSECEYVISQGVKAAIKSLEES